MLLSVREFIDTERRNMILSFGTYGKIRNLSGVRSVGKEIQARNTSPAAWRSDSVEEAVQSRAFLARRRGVIIDRRSDQFYSTHGYLAD